jgi:hypothetical protein
MTSFPEASQADHLIAWTREEQEKTMKRIHARVNRRVAVAVAAMAVAMTGSSVFAQETASTTGTSTSTSTPTIRVPRTEATPQMIEEAIQRSQARTEKLRTTGRPEQWGSEEPFTYVPER